jgi:HPt (histidine-containing phosphotransfer) domain-containing protein
MANNVYIDVEEGLKRVVSNTALYTKLLGKFKDDGNYKKVCEALADKKMDDALSAAHSLKGLTANLSFTKLFNQCVELEAQIKAGSVEEGQLDTVKEIYNETLVEIDKVIAQYA